MTQLQENNGNAVALARQVLASLRPDVAAALRELAGGPQRQDLRPHRATGRPPGFQLVGAAAQLKDRAWLEGEYAEHSAEQIAVNVGCNVKTVLRWLRKHEIPIRQAGSTRRHVTAAERGRRAADAATMLCEWAEAHGGRAPTVAEWEDTRPEGSFSEKTLRHLFGSWHAACAAAGLKSHGSGWRDPEAERLRREAQKRLLLDGLKAWAGDHDGEAPTSTEWDANRPNGLPTSAVVRKLFGTWGDGVKAAGLRPLRLGEKKNVYGATARGKTPAANRQMVTGKGLSDRLPGTVKHFGDGMRDAA